jgi:hypothetical protein
MMKKCIGWLRFITHTRWIFKAMVGRVDKTIKETTKKCLELSFMEARFLCPRD